MKTALIVLCLPFVIFAPMSPAEVVDQESVTEAGTFYNLCTGENLEVILTTNTLFLSTPHGEFLNIGIHESVHGTTTGSLNSAKYTLSGLLNEQVNVSKGAEIIVTEILNLVGTAGATDWKVRRYRHLTQDATGRLHLTTSRLESICK